MWIQKAGFLYPHLFPGVTNRGMLVLVIIVLVIIVVVVLVIILELELVVVVLIIIKGRVVVEKKGQ